jgi:hypothetical protein
MVLREQILAGAALALNRTRIRKIVRTPGGKYGNRSQDESIRRQSFQLRFPNSPNAD